jgi:hypothetical protein
MATQKMATNETHTRAVLTIADISARFDIDLIWNSLYENKKRNFLNPDTVN